MRARTARARRDDDDDDADVFAVHTHDSGHEHALAQAGRHHIIKTSHQRSPRACVCVLETVSGTLGRGLLFINKSACALGDRVAHALLVAKIPSGGRRTIHALQM